MLPGRYFKDVAMRAWRSTRLFAFVLLAVALIVGAHLRFHRLARYDMSGDEAASWAAASARSVWQVAQIERQLDPGKLALYDVTLHEWIGFFGDSVFAMRAMSAGLGTMAIILVFITVCEVYRSLADEKAACFAELTGAFAALLYATNLQMVLSDRMVRMYPFVMCAELLQITFLVRAQRRGGILNYIGVALFTAVMIASNFTATFLVAAEASWLGWLLLAKLWNSHSHGLAVFRPTCAIAVGMVILMPWARNAFISSQRSMTWLDWIKLQPITWPFAVLRGSTGDSTLFWIFVALSSFGIWRQWRSARSVVEFFTMWMVGPILAVMAVTYLIHPLEFPRYVLTAFVGMFAFAALGVASLGSTALRLSLAIMLIDLSVGPVHRWVRQSHEAAWRNGTLLAVQQSMRGEQIAVFPSWCVNVVRFYTPPERREDVTETGAQCGAAPVLVMSGIDMFPPAVIGKIDACYPRNLADLPFIQVRSR
jgi:hypothetical protein